MASPPEGEKPPVEFEVAAFWFHNAAENVAEEIVSEIVTRAQEVLHERVTTARAATVSANCLMEHLLSHLDACFMRHDKGEIGAGESDWEFEPEPRPALADSWSRNAIAQRRKRKPKVEENQFVGDEKPAARRRPQGTPLQTVEEGKSNPPETIPIRMPTPIDDPEEDALRNQKGREMKRKQEEEAKQRRKQKVR
uniref:Uncharacterized protein n=1 Tax=Chromera velia CCMP2878 TaxID=1169474 RepID=A0A0G4HEJ4_9ALVE|eukprot:Cvel_26653.t1-p1 / transcript=Cvel_26653.t1 / gene=Cvel_26653 / organism=Chromera_velia_CCMP2878 / gene_product=hypothetical protein / transcript_product=hypothetical protein / location=Cvel_scaffold3207:185-1056(-) / protein_length=194 / sequence_SO=supercontig / SO=protein_coding / is_pseudo=false